MKYKAFAITVALLALTIPAWCATSATTAFDTLKGLAGQWQTKGPDGKPLVITWKVVSVGSAVMEVQTQESMITMYHLDKDRLMMTHYCSAQNQPRMQASISDDGKTFTFDFLDATNLANPADGHMRKMVLTVLDKDHFTEQWLFSKDGKDETGTFHLIRKK